MREIITRVYQFNELNDGAKQTALDDFLYDINISYEWWEFIVEDAKMVGIRITDFDVYGRTCEGEFITNAIDVKKAIMETHGRMCDTYKTVQDFDFRRNVDEKEMLHLLLEDYQSLLIREYDYLISDEAIIDTIQANEYEFTESGKLI